MPETTLLEAAPSGESGAFIVYSDLHFDPFQDLSIVGELADADASQWGEIFASSTLTSLATYGEEANYPLFISLLDDMAGHADEVNFVFMGGDVLSHKFQEKYAAATGDAALAGLEDFTNKTLEYVAMETAKRFPEDSVYFTLGNNDSLEGDYKIQPFGAYLRDSSAILSEYWIKDEANAASFLSTYPAAGYYSVSPEGTDGLRLIVLNGVLWHTNYVDATGAGAGELAWFSGQLADAARNNEKVWVLTHMPEGIDAFQTISMNADPASVSPYVIMKEPYNEAFIDLTGAYNGTIAAEFAGHVHRDDFRFVTDDTGEAIEMMHVFPSISPVYDNNPGYQLFTYDAGNFGVLDYTTYYLDLGAASPVWKEEYTFSEAYGNALAGPNDWTSFYQNLLTDPLARDNYAEFYDVSLDSNNQITPDNYNAFWLALTRLTGEDYQAAYDALVQGAAPAQTSAFAAPGAASGALAVGN